MTTSLPSKTDESNASDTAPSRLLSPSQAQATSVSAGSFAGQALLPRPQLCVPFTPREQQDSSPLDSDDACQFKRVSKQDADQAEAHCSGDSSGAEAFIEISIQSSMVDQNGEE